jgi:outer membrane immunogenic protein
MRRIAILAAGLSIMAQAALAADLRPPPPPPPVVKAPPPPVYYFSWTGCYFGGNGGGLWLTKDYTLTSIVGVPVVPAGFGGHDASSWIAGVQVGCNYQFAGGFVVGAQADYDWTNANGSHGDAFGFGTSHTSETRSLGSVTGRIGYAWDRFLGYVKGGWAWERDNYSWIIPVGGGATAALTASETRGGWTVGIGGEYAFLDWLTGFIEYDYYDFGTSNVAFTPFAPITAVNFDIRETKSVVKAGLNFKFGPSPVVARY